MKLWQLGSIVNGDIKLLARVASRRSQWREYQHLADTFPALVKAQDRAKLDLMLDAEFVEAVLHQFGGTCFLSTDGWLRSSPMSPEDMSLTFVVAFQRYGGDLLEQALERGTVRVP